MTDLDFRPLQSLLESAVESTGADFGNVQVMDGGALEIAAHKGFSSAFLERFRRVDPTDTTACGRALSSRKQVVVNDVEIDAGFAPYRRFAAEAGYRSVQSTPLIGRSGSVLGVMSTHYRQTRGPQDKALRLAALYARLSAAYIEQMRLEGEVDKRDRRRNPAEDGVGKLSSIMTRVRESVDNETVLRALSESAEQRVSRLVKDLDRIMTQERPD